MEKSEKSSGIGSIMAQIDIAFNMLKSIPLDKGTVTAVLIQNNLDPMQFDGMLNDPQDIATGLAETLACSPSNISEHQKNNIINSLIANSTFKTEPAQLCGRA